MNGGSMLAMAGKDCVALAVDKRFGSGLSLVTIAPRHLLVPSSNMLVAFAGLEGDVQSLQLELASQINAKYSRGLGFLSRQKAKLFSPKVMASLTSHVLYHRRQAPYFVEPIIAGLDMSVVKVDTEAPEHGNDSTTEQADKANCRPYLCSMDMIGAQSESRAFVCGGTASKSLYGTAEALWQPDLSEDELVKVCGVAFLSALERDCLSGYGATVYLINSDGITEYELASRND
jgi:20S proteasome subunit beta 3